MYTVCVWVWIWVESKQSHGVLFLQKPYGVHEKEKMFWDAEKGKLWGIKNADRCSESEDAPAQIEEVELYR